MMTTRKSSLTEFKVRIIFHKFNFHLFDWNISGKLQKSHESYYNEKQKNVLRYLYVVQLSILLLLISTTKLLMCYVSHPNDLNILHSWLFSWLYFKGLAIPHYSFHCFPIQLGNSWSSKYNECSSVLVI